MWTLGPAQVSAVARSGRTRASLRRATHHSSAQVYVEGPTEAQVQQACDMIEPLLNPESPAVDELKERHQNALAEINGAPRPLAASCFFCRLDARRGSVSCPATRAEGASEPLGSKSSH